MYPHQAAYSLVAFKVGTHNRVNSSPVASGGAWGSGPPAKVLAPLLSFVPLIDRIKKI